MALSLDDTLPDPEWLKRKYGILWDGRYRAVDGRIAHVVRIACVRISSKRVCTWTRARGI